MAVQSCLKVFPLVDGCHVVERVWTRQHTVASPCHSPRDLERNVVPGYPQMKTIARPFVALVLAAGLAGCTLSPPSKAPNGGADAAEKTSSAALEAEESPSEEPSAEEAEFDLESVPVADALTGDFPYFDIPDGYANPNRDIPIDDYGRIPFWTGKDLHWVEGTTYQSIIHAADGENFSSIELKKLVDDAITEAGGVQIADSKIPADILADIDDETRRAYVAGWGDIYNEPTITYVVRTADSLVWIHLCSDSASAGWLIVEAEA